MTTMKLVFLAILIFGLYVLYDRMFVSKNANLFWDNWAKRTLKLWLPWYALKRLVNEVILKKNK